jgi:hypothetical protein
MRWDNQARIFKKLLLMVTGEVCASSPEITRTAVLLALENRVGEFLIPLR